MLSISSTKKCENEKTRKEAGKERRTTLPRAPNFLEQQAIPECNEIVLTQCLLFLWLVLLLPLQKGTSRAVGQNNFFFKKQLFCYKHRCYCLDPHNKIIMSLVRCLLTYHKRMMLGRFGNTPQRCVTSSWSHGRKPFKNGEAGFSHYLPAIPQFYQPVMRTTGITTTTLRATSSNHRNNNMVNYRQNSFVWSISSRSYWYFPTSWTEWKHRMWTACEKRTITVKFLTDQFRNNRAALRTRYQAFRRKQSEVAKRTLSEMHVRWKQSKTQRRYEAVKERGREWKQRWLQVATNTRDAARIQRRRLFPGWKYYVTLTEYSQEDWFHKPTGRPLTSRDPTGRYVNPWLSRSADGVHSIWTLFEWRWQRLRREWAIFTKELLGGSKPRDDASRSLLTDKHVAMEHLLPPPENTTTALNGDPHNVFLTWIGHSTCLLQQSGLNILTDPIFSTRASPFQRSIIGVPRSVPPSCTIDALPPIDVCLVSHDHYDHLDLNSVSELKDKVALWVVPIGLSEWMHQNCNIPVDRIVELEWWETLKFESIGLNKWTMTGKYSLRDYPNHHPAVGNINESSLYISCLPAQHWSSRTFFDRNYRLWCSFACLLPNDFLFYFAGDTAKPHNQFPLFEQIRDYLGRPTDLAALPIGAYEPVALCRAAHLNPEEAHAVHQALEARQSVAIHWGTFALAEEPLNEPAEWLASLDDDSFFSIQHGERVEFLVREPGAEPVEGVEC